MNISMYLKTMQTQTKMHSWNSVETQLSFSWSSTNSVGIVEFELLKYAFNSYSTRVQLAFNYWTQVEREDEVERELKVGT